MFPRFAFELFRINFFMASYSATSQRLVNYLKQLEISSLNGTKLTKWFVKLCRKSESNILNTDRNIFMWENIRYSRISETAFLKIDKFIPNVILSLAKKKGITNPISLKFIISLVNKHCRFVNHNHRYNRYLLYPLSIEIL